MLSWTSLRFTQTMSCKRMSSPCDKMMKTCMGGLNGYDN
nr:MAG TPA: hypothetical protein [Caudoviricetes sp.]